MTHTSTERSRLLPIWAWVAAAVCVVAIVDAVYSLAANVSFGAVFTLGLATAGLLGFASVAVQRYLRRRQDT